MISHIHDSIMFIMDITVPTRAPTKIVSIVHDEAPAYATEPYFDEILLGQALLEEHQFFELHVRLRVIRKVSLVYFA